MADRCRSLVRRAARLSIWPRMLLPLWVLGVSLAPPSAGDPVPGLERLQHLPADNPLVDQWVRVIYQDRRGFLWLGTIDGVHRFDGYTIKSLRGDPADPGSLPHNFVTGILEDRQSYLWVATAGGLARLEDGAPTAGGRAEFLTEGSSGRFRVFRHDPQDPSSLSNNYTTGLAEDRHGDLWVSTTSGVSRFDRESLGFTRYALDPADLESTRTLSVVRSRSDDLWFGAEGPALLRFDYGKATLEEHLLAERSSEGVWRVVEDGDGFLWAGTEGGALFRFDPRTGETRRFPLTDESPGYVTALSVQPDGNLWVGTDKQGLLILDPATGSFRAYRPMTDQQGSLSNLQVSSIYRDRSDVVWLGTGAGLDRYVPAHERFALYRRRTGDPTSLIDDQVASVVEDRRGNLWVGTESGLSQMGRSGRVLRNYRHRSEEPESLLNGGVEALLEDHEGDLWIGTDQGLDCLDIESEVLTHLRYDPADPQGLISAIHSLAEAPPGVLWAGGLGGLNRLDKATRRLERYPDLGTVLAIRTAQTGGLWLATYGKGLRRFDPARGVQQTYANDPTNPQSLSSDFLAALHQDTSGVLWIGSLGGGLSRFEPQSESFVSYRARDGLASDNVVAILEDASGDLWLGSDRGLTRFDVETGSAIVYSVEDGLQGSVFNHGAAWQSSTGEMFFGGTSGLTRFDPGQITLDPLAPEVAITDFLLLNQSTPLSARRDDKKGEIPHLVLDHRDDIFAFEFAALHFVKPGQNRYAYQLQGFNDTWIPTDARNRLAQYTNLDPGPYTFRVKAANSDGVWNEEGAAVRITVLPPPWRTWWAYGFYAAGVVAIVGGYLRSHREELRREQATAQRERQAAERERAVNRRLREVDKLKDELVVQRTAEVAERERLLEERQQLIRRLEAKNAELARFNYTMAHDLKNPLVTILNFLGLARRDMEHGATARLEDDFERLERAAEQLHRQLEELYELSKIGLRATPQDAVPLDGLVRSVVSKLAARIAERRAVVDVEADLPTVHGDRSQLGDLFRHLVDNALCYAGEGQAPRVEVGLRQQDGERVFTVRDHGIGIDPRYHEKVFDLFERLDPDKSEGTGIGLALAKQIVEVHGGRMWVESEGLGQGCTFCFTLPEDRHGMP
ncbi:MAG: two-component regulator propeller domain-containing protein [Acidobacteriota bacterium]